jgi:hypothetical protein
MWEHSDDYSGVSLDLCTQPNSSTAIQKIICLMVFTPGQDTRSVLDENGNSLARNFLSTMVVLT